MFLPERIDSLNERGHIECQRSATAPRISRVAVMWNPKDPSSVQQWQESQIPSREIGLQLYSMQISSAAQFENGFKEAVKAHSSALFVVSNALATSNRKRLTALAARYRLPAIYAQSSFVSEGGLLAYAPDQDERFRRAAALIDKVLRGAKPSDIPVEQPTKFELVINLQAARQIGVTIAPSLMTQADRVIR